MRDKVIVLTIKNHHGLIERIFEVNKESSLAMFTFPEGDIPKGFTFQTKGVDDKGLLKVELHFNK